MKTLVSVMAVAFALAWPTAGEAQSRTSKAKSPQTTQQKYVPARKRAVVARSAQVPCERRVWWGCVGWDPDPNVRNMLGRDVGGDD